MFMKDINISFFSVHEGIENKVSNIYLHTHFRSESTLNSQQVETVQKFMNMWMNKQNVAQCILVSLESCSIACFNMNEPWMCYANWNKADINGQIMFESIHMNYVEESDRECGCQG